MGSWYQADLLLRVSWEPGLAIVRSSIALTKPQRGVIRAYSRCCHKFTPLARGCEVASAEPCYPAAGGRATKRGAEAVLRHSATLALSGHIGQRHRRRACCHRQRRGLQRCGPQRRGQRAVQRRGVAQLGGTDSGPTRPARPKPAESPSAPTPPSGVSSAPAAGPGTSGSVRAFSGQAHEIRRVTQVPGRHVEA